MVNEGIRQEGAFYLFTLRLVPIFPFFLVNLLMGLTPIKTSTFFIASFIGMLPGIIVFVNAGSRLGQIQSLKSIFSPGMLMSFAALGILPLLAKGTVNFYKRKRRMPRFRKPKHFDYNLVVIGAGSGGLVASYIAAALKAKVALIEKHKMGGDCLNTGCIPSKAFIRSAKLLAEAKRASDFGFKKMSLDYDFVDVMERVQRVIHTVAPHDSVERYAQLGVEVFLGEARIESPWVVQVNGKNLTTKNIFIATGASPLVPPLPGLDEISYFTTDTIWELRELPRRLVVLGGGPVGAELAQSFQRFGSEATLVEMAAHLLPREDNDVADFVEKKFQQEGIRTLTGHKAKRFVIRGEGRVLVCEHNEDEVEVEFDQVLLALGRKANVKNFGLEELGVELAPGGTILADEFLRTTHPNIFVCGDVVGPYQFTHVAAHQAWYAAVNALFGSMKKFKADYRVIPWSTFTDPEVAHVGLNEKEARQKGISYTKTVYDLSELDRAITDEEAHGFVKVLSVPGNGQILGTTIVGSHAGELIAEYVLAMRQRVGLNRILNTIHVYPTLMEANRSVVGLWRKAHVSKFTLGWLKRFHRWKRGTPPVNHELLAREGR